MTSHYKVPPQSVIDILDAPPAPVVRISPDGVHLVRLEYDNLPPIEVLAQPMVGLAGVRINPLRNEHRRSIYFTGLVIQRIDDGTEKRVALPEGIRIARMMWSPNGRYIAFTRSGDEGNTLWLIDVHAASAQRLLEGRLINDTMGYPVQWLSGSTHLVLRLIPEGRAHAPEEPSIPLGPVVEDTDGRSATNRTYQDLLSNRHDEHLFEHFMTSQVAVLELASGALQEIGSPGIFREVSPSPDGQYMLVKQLRRPWSYSVPYLRFAHTIELWQRDGEMAHTLADLDVADEVPTMGVPTGPRGIAWQALEPATLVWTEAQDGGDPLAKVEHRECLYQLPAPFEGEPREVMRLKERFANWTWLSLRKQALVTEYDRDRRWITTAHITVPDEGEVERKVLFDRSYHDRYADPGNPILRTLPNTQHVVDVDDEGHIYLSGDGATPEGDRPFLDRYHLETGETTRLFHAAEGRYESFVDFVASHAFVIRSESASDPPSFHLLQGDTRRELYATPHPHPELSSIPKELVTYERKDGVSLSGTLYLPPDRKEGERLPLLIWAYPMEYNDAATAGQIRSAPTRFTRLGGSSPLFFITQGYAVLDRAAMPVVGDPETMNDTFVEQIVDAASAAIEALDARGLIDPARVGVAGHSYGAFMVANLLAHCDLFKAGIARSGAYNRSLTPFGFQGERRNLWEARDTYVELSPFFAAHTLKRPILLIHGDIDPNPGTFPLQSKRLFHALQGLGGTARLVLLPHEGHGYRARESIFHVLAESFAWFDRYVTSATSDVAQNTSPEVEEGA